MKQVDYKDIFKTEQNGKKGEYYDQHPDDYKRLVGILSGTMGSVLLQVFDKESSRKEFFETINKKTKYTSGEDKGKQSIIEHFGQLMIQMHRPTKERYSIKQIENYNEICDQLDNIITTITGNKFNDYQKRKIEMVQYNSNKKSNNTSMLNKFIQYQY